MVALFCFSSSFFLLKDEKYFAHFFTKIVKPKCKTRFSKLLKGYVCYISDIRHSKLRGFQKNKGTKTNKQKTKQTNKKNLQKNKKNHRLGLSSCYITL